MNKNVKKLVAATVVAGLAVAPVAAQTTTPVAQAAEQAQSKYVVAKFVQKAEGNFVQVTATQDVQDAKVTISVDGKGQHVVNVGNLKKGETKLVPFNVDAKKVGNGFAPKALPKTAAVTDHVTISKTINSHLVRATVSYKYEDGKPAVKTEVPGDKAGNKGDVKVEKPGEVKPTPAPGKSGEATPAPGVPSKNPSEPGTEAPGLPGLGNPEYKEPVDKDLNGKLIESTKKKNDNVAKIEEGNYSDNLSLIRSLLAPKAEVRS